MGMSTLIEANRPTLSHALAITVEHYPFRNKNYTLWFVIPGKVDIYISLGM